MTEKNIRQPIISVLGHVDHGKTLLLDKIRGTTVASREAGAITQHIGATGIPVETVKGICGGFLKKFAKEKVDLPGLLFIDTPGHEAFANLRSRGGALADLAVLVVDITQGFQPQTIESINYIKENKTPFVVAANKIDLIPGWKPMNNACFLESIPEQNTRVQTDLDKRTYELIGKLNDYGFNSERFDRLENFRKQIGIVPTSAKTGEGIPELLAILTGLAQTFMKKELSVEVTGPAKGTVLEVKKERGLGKTIDTIIYDGKISTQDKIAVGGLGKVIVTKVRALLQPKPLDEIRDPQEKFEQKNYVTAAAGVKIAAPDIEEVVAGAPLRVIESDKDLQEFCQLVKKRLESVRIQKDEKGIIVKADTLGSLEALETQLESSDIPIKHGDIGDITRQNVVEASAVAEDDPFLGVILAFNVDIPKHAKEEAKNRDVKIIENDVIYRLIEEYEEWVEKEKEKLRREKLKELIRPGKFTIKLGYVFRKSQPAVVGVDILGGILKPDVPIMKKDGERVGIVREIQSEKETKSEAKSGDEVAFSIEGPTIGRQIKEGDVLYTDIPPRDIMKLKELSEMLTDDEKAVMEEIITIKQKNNPTYGVM